LIDGITENFIIKYGAEFINKINNNDKKPTKQCNTIEETYNLYKEGKTIDEIANIRDLKPLTIENHIINKWSNNKDEINKDFAKLTKKIEDEIISAVEKVGFEKLRPIKDIISKDITYFQIRTVLIEC
jgi:ATP-dependent DNA helicase RecQ